MKVWNWYCYTDVYNLLEYNSNYSITSRSLWTYYRDEVNDGANENNNDINYRINNNKTTASKSFEFMSKLIGSTLADDETSHPEVVVPLKYFSNFWRYFDLPFIKCEIELDLKWLKYCVIS